MTDAELEAIEARANEARPGPWRPVWDKHRPTKAEGFATEGGVCVMGDGAPAHFADAEFIAAARSDVPALVAEVRKLKAAMGVVNQALLEVAHAQQSGPEWYTKGASGLRQQVRMWVERGLNAIAEALK